MHGRPERDGRAEAPSAVGRQGPRCRRPASASSRDDCFMVTPRSGGSRRDDSGQARPIWRCAARRPSRSRCAANDHAHVAAWDKLPWGWPSSPVGDARTRSRGAVVARCHLSEQAQGRPPRIISRGHPCRCARYIALPPRRAPAASPDPCPRAPLRETLPTLPSVRAPAASRNPCRCSSNRRLLNRPTPLERGRRP